MAFKKILVPYDTSAYARRAFKEAVAIAKTHDAKLTIITIVEPNYSANLGFALKVDAKQMKKIQDEAVKHIESLRGDAEKQGVDFSYKILRDTSTTKALVKYADAGKYDLVVIGSHGRTGFRKLVLGSVANSVLQHVKASVLVIR